MLRKTAIEPNIPTQRLRPLEDLACTIVERAARLSSKLREPLRVQVAELTRWMNCYYSNLIEGQQTRVRDIEAALKKDFAAEPEKRDLQQLSLAHLEAQKWAVAQSSSPFSTEFICELHRWFYEHLPEDLRLATTSKGKKTPLTPGELRDRDVEVGTHVGPPHELVLGLIKAHHPRVDRVSGNFAIIGPAENRSSAETEPFSDDLSFAEFAVSESTRCLSLTWRVFHCDHGQYFSTYPLISKCAHLPKKG